MTESAEHPIHPHYGPCDALGSHGICAACAEAYQTAITAAQQERDEALALAAAMREALSALVPQDFEAHPQDFTSEWHAAYRAINMPAPQARANLEARIRADERKKIAKWHDAEARACMSGMHCGMSNSERRNAHAAADWHERSAKEIRQRAQEG